VPAQVAKALFHSSFCCAYPRYYIIGTSALATSSCQCLSFARPLSYTVIAFLPSLGMERWGGQVCTIKSEAIALAGPAGSFDEHGSIAEQQRDIDTGGEAFLGRGRDGRRHLGLFRAWSRWPTPSRPF
jgi:hypothetical protein